MLALEMYVSERDLLSVRVCTFISEEQSGLECPP